MTDVRAAAPPVVRPIAVRADRSEETFRWSRLPFDAQRTRLYALSVPYALMNGLPVDDFLFEDDLVPAHIERPSLEQWWGLTNSDECHDMLARLSESRMGWFYELTTSLALQALDYPAGHEIEKAHRDFLTGLAVTNGWDPVADTYGKWVAALRDPRIRTLLPDRIPDVSVAWNLARTVLVARSAYECEYLTTAEAGGYIRTALLTAQNVFPDWQAYGASFLAGRIFWTLDEPSEQVVEAAQEWANRLRRCLADPDSPWNHVTLRP